MLAVNWLLTRFRIVDNLKGDAIGARIVYHMSKAELCELDRKEEEKQDHDRRNFLLKSENIVCKANKYICTQSKKIENNFVNILNQRLNL